MTLFPCVMERVNDCGTPVKVSRQVVFLATWCGTLVHVFAFPGRRRSPRQAQGGKKAPRVTQKETRRLANRGSCQHKANYFGTLSTILDASCRIIQAFVAVWPLVRLARKAITELVTATTFHNFEPSNVHQFKSHNTALYSTSTDLSLHHTICMLTCRAL